MEQWKIWLS